MSSDSATRSAPVTPGTKPRWIRRVLVLTLLTLAIAAGVYLRWWRQNLRRFEIVRPGVLYRCGQPSTRGIAYLASRHGVKTDLSLRRAEPRLRTGLLFKRSKPDGPNEEQWAREVGVDYVRWPLGDEVYWPWTSPWHFENLFALYDERENWPIVVHCAEGRHRTGTYAALFRLEYDRWDVERALEEMYSFDFGPAQFIQEHNLRTYLPRPRPDANQWNEVSAAFSDLLPAPPPGNYEELVYRLRRHPDREAVRQTLTEYLDAGGGFSLPLAGRLIDWPDNPASGLVAEHASRELEDDGADPAEISIGAALVADFGTSQQQQLLLDFLAQRPTGQAPDARYEALVAGVTNRYTDNRIAYLRPLLEDVRPRLLENATQYRYCDTAVVRLTSIVNQRFLPEVALPVKADWNRGVEAAIKWFDEHPESLAPKPVSPVEGL